MALFRFLAPALLMALSVSTLQAETVWATRDVPARRWQTAETPASGDVKTNDRLEVVYKTDAWVRVRLPQSPKFGWVPADAVTATAPAGAEQTLGAGIEGLTPEMQQRLQEMQQQFQQREGQAE